VPVVWVGPDELETRIAADLWPMPTCREMLKIR